MRAKFPKHLDFIRSLPCVICGNDTQTEAAHIRFGDLSVAKPMTGIGIKPNDCWTVPLCNEHHRQQHAMGEKTWWESVEIDPIFLAMALYCASGNYEAGEQIVSNAGQPILKATLRVADAVIQGHLMSAFSSAEGTQQMLGVRKAIAAALNE